ncbi:MAG: hypothetical protein IPK26_04550 [Planctomycetes bacterium]|nr:hypothetical protein [Planctomycetota bacterium]
MSNRPPEPLDRRQFLGDCARLAAGTVCCPIVTAGADQPRELLTELIEVLTAGDRDTALHRVAIELRAAPCHDIALDAVAVAAAMRIRSDVPAFNHIALATHAVRQLLPDVEPAVADRRVLWLVDRLYRDGGWRQPALAPGQANANAAATALRAALDDWQTDAAEQAVATFAAATTPAACFDVLREYGLRCHQNLGHKAIYTALLAELLPRLPPAQQVVMLRSLVRSFMIHGRSERGVTFAAAREAVADLPAGGVAIADATARADMLAALRGNDPANAMRQAARSWRRGITPAALWDCVLLTAAETSVHDGGDAALHAVTSAEAMLRLARRGGTPAEQALPLVQASAWQVLFRRRGNPPPLDTVAVGDIAMPSGATWLERCLDTTAGSPRDRTVRVFALTAAQRVEFSRQLRTHVAAAATDVHHVKLGAAVLELLPQAAVITAPALLAAALQHVPEPGPLAPELTQLPAR